MFCPRCGEKLPDSANFCTACGMEFDDSIKSSLSSNERTKNKESKKSGKGKLCVPFILIIGIAIAGFTIYEECVPNLTIDGISFHIPYDYQLEDEYSGDYEIFVNGTVYQAVGEKSIYFDDNEYIRVSVYTFKDNEVFTIDDIDSYMYLDSDIANTTINGHDGVIGYDFYYDYKIFMYVENDKLVFVECTDPDLIDKIVV